MRHHSPSDPVDRLPLLCRLRGHGWRRDRGVVPGSWTRSTCDRCADLWPPTPA